MSRSYKLIDDDTAADIHDTVSDWAHPLFPRSSQLAIKEFLANQRGMTFYSSIAES